MRFSKCTIIKWIEMTAVLLSVLLCGGKEVIAETGRTIVFYGDSNTYGYDPADMGEGRYPEEQRWTTILQKNVGSQWTIVSEGLNGRKIPDLPQAAGWLSPVIEEAGEDGIFAVMLGTNDILSYIEPNVEEVRDRMDAFLSFLTGKMDPDRILVITPVPSGRKDDENLQIRKYYEACISMNSEFEDLADVYGVHFADTADWGVELCYDLVHISEEGQKTFAVEMEKVLRELDKTRPEA